MADQFLAEQHKWTLIQNSQSDERDSWVMLTRDGEIVPIPGEKILHTSRPRVSLEISTPRELQVAEPFSLKCDNGIAYITNERVSFSFRPPLAFRGVLAPEDTGRHEADQPAGHLPPSKTGRGFQILLYACAEFHRYARSLVVDWSLELGRHGQASSRGWHPHAHPPDRSQVHLQRWRPQRLSDEV